MLLEGGEVRHDPAARALSLWMVGLGLWVATVLGHGALRLYLFSDAVGAHEVVRVVSIVLQLLGLGSGVAIALGAWRYASATEPGSALLRIAAVALAGDPVVDAFYLFLRIASDGADFLEYETYYTVLHHVWTVLALARVGALILFFTRMARLSEALGQSLPDARVWGAIGTTLLWGVVVATARVELFDLDGLVGYLFDSALVLVVAGTALALMRPHRAHLRVGAATAADAAPEPVPGLAAAGRGLGRYHAAIVSQIGFLVLGNLLTIGAAKGGDPEAARGVMMVVLIVGFGIQLVAISGLASFARRLPFFHAARGPASTAAILQGLNALLGLVSTVLVIRAFESNRLSLLFDLQDQLPVLEGLSVILGCFAAVAVLTAIENTGVLGELESAGGLKLAIPALGAFVMVFKLLDHRDLGAAATLGLGVVLLVVAISVAVAFLGRVRRAASAMQLQL